VWEELPEIVFKRALRGSCGPWPGVLSVMA
jgi:hypothetical protein